MVGLGGSPQASWCLYEGAVGYCKTQHDLLQLMKYGVILGLSEPSVACTFAPVHF